MEFNAHAEIIRKKYSLRRKILTGELRIHHDIAARLIGPDTAYHLYRYEDSHDKKSKQLK